MPKFPSEHKNGSGLTVISGVIVLGTLGVFRRFFQLPLPPSTLSLPIKGMGGEPSSWGREVACKPRGPAVPGRVNCSSSLAGKLDFIL